MITTARSMVHWNDFRASVNLSLRDPLNKTIMNLSIGVSRQVFTMGNNMDSRHLLGTGGIVDTNFDTPVEE